ncbi:MAG: DUF3419 family protein [Bacteroidales bacterium]
MEPLFEYGITQEDSHVDARALDLHDGDRLLCISSAGDTPLNLLANYDIHINAVDILENQNRLAQLKLAAVRSLEPAEAAALTGFVKATPESRRKLFEKVAPYLPDPDQVFWKSHPEAVDRGPVNVARFEQYMARFNGLGLILIGRKHLYRLFEMDTVADQQAYFDRHMSTGLLRGIFRIVFHPRVYKKRGISPAGLTHSGERNSAEFFYGKLRDFCTATPARRNYYLQFTFFNQVLFPEALPDYLEEGGMTRIRANHDNLVVKRGTFKEMAEQYPENHFNKFHLSNIGDWMSKDEFAALLRMICAKSAAGTKLLFRYIHYNHPIPDDLSGRLRPDYDLGERLLLDDRYPFYGVVPLYLA